MAKLSKGTSPTPPPAWGRAWHASATATEAATRNVSVSVHTREHTHGWDRVTHDTDFCWCRAAPIARRQQMWQPMDVAKIPERTNLWPCSHVVLSLAVLALEGFIDLMDLYMWYCWVYAKLV